MRIIRFIIAAAASSAAVAQQAPTPPPAAQPPITVTGQKADSDKPVCKYTDTGTLIPKKVCMPKSEWARAQSRDAEAMKTMRDWQRVRCNMGSGC
jgi:hypothetical protein